MTKIGIEDQKPQEVQEQTTVQVVPVVPSSPVADAQTNATINNDDMKDGNTELDETILYKKKARRRRRREVKSQRESRGWYKISIISTICCCPLFGIIGLIHSMFAIHEGERGNIDAQIRRSRQAKTWTTLSLVFGIAGYLMVFFMFLGASYYYGYLACSWNDEMNEDAWVTDMPPKMPTPIS